MLYHRLTSALCGIGRTVCRVVSVRRWCRVRVGVSIYADAWHTNIRMLPQHPQLLADRWISMTVARAVDLEDCDSGTE